MKPYPYGIETLPIYTRQRLETETSDRDQTLDENKTKTKTLRPPFGEALEISGLGNAKAITVSQVAPILMHRDEVIALKEAAHRAGKTDKTIRGWCKEYGIGRQAKPSAPIEISAPALEMVLHGDAVALELLREGKRSHPRVKQYFDFLGVPI